MTTTIAQGIHFFPQRLDRSLQTRLIARVWGLTAEAPFYRPTMPNSGAPFSVEMTNLGELGWVSDKSGYRYQECHPVTGRPWPAIPDELIDLWRDVSGGAPDPQCCLVNWYKGPKAKMGLHQDKDEQDLSCPVVSVSLGDRARFRIGGLTRKGPTQSVVLSSGDVIVMGGDNRLAFHGIDRIYPDTSTVVPGGGRINLTLRRVTV